MLINHNANVTYVFTFDTLKTALIAELMEFLTIRIKL